MKKGYLIALILISSLALSGCLPKKDQTKTTMGNRNEVLPPAEKDTISEDNSLMMIEEELNDTDVDDFEKELDALDEDINQL